ncbi:hypothetical protein RclHR1_20360001 [Rhizophagus clarus]|nr:hypothetical protein RclHR1_20360001 [Rhizophagus clarus]
MLTKLKRLNLIFHHEYNWPTQINQNTIKLINEIFNKESSKWQLNKITNTITAREQNYKLSPTKLLNLILEHLPTIWQEIYRLKPTSSIECDSLLLPILQDELATTIKGLPNNKAAGSNGLTYEIWKKFPKKYYDMIISLFNDILKLETIPSRWQEALLYPILKPEYWNCNLSMTRPIILLDTLRKIFTKILTQCYQRYLTNTSIFQKTNQAGLHGFSTMEIIFKIQTIIDYHKDALHSNSPFYIMIQDLSKAYDRVNLSLLDLALKRIGLPTKLVTVIINLFKNHKNKIILPMLLSESYDLKIRIIQGEVCSSLLWIIYYDPMFEVIEKSNTQGITLTASILKSIYHLHDNFVQQENFKLLGYLDDTTWTKNYLSDLTESLKIADEFYTLANIKINKNKCKLITNDPQLIHTTSTQLPSETK